jgi:hypothetical protein
MYMPPPEVYAEPSIETSRTRLLVPVRSHTIGETNVVMSHASAVKDEAEAEEVKKTLVIEL